MKIGDIKITPIHDASTEVDLNTMFCSGLNIEPYRSLLTENGQYRIPMGGFLIEKEILQDGKTKPAKILVDVGQGLPAFSPAFGHFLDNFQKLGISPNDITDIIFTHLHMDHIGWAVDVTDNNKVVFPNAEYWIHVADLDHFLPQESQFPGVISVKERLTPILNSPEKCKVHKIPKNQEITEIYPGINI